MLCFGQIERAARRPAMRVRALSGPDDGGSTSATVEGAGRAAVHRQHLPLRAGRLGGPPRCSAGCRRRSATKPTPGSRKMGQLQERITSTRKGASVTSIQAIYVPADDLNRPGAPPVGVRAPQRPRRRSPAAISEKGIYPAVDPARLDVGRSSSPEILGDEHFNVRQRGTSRCCRRYRGACKDIIAILGIDELSDEDRQPRPGARAKIERFPCRSRSTWAEQFTGTPGSVRADRRDGCARSARVARRQARRPARVRVSSSRARSTTGRRGREEELSMARTPFTVEVLTPRGRGPSTTRSRCWPRAHEPWGSIGCARPPPAAADDASTRPSCGLQQGPRTEVLRFRPGRGPSCRCRGTHALVLVDEVLPIEQLEARHGRGPPARGRAALWSGPSRDSEEGPVQAARREQAPVRRRFSKLVGSSLTPSL